MNFFCLLGLHRWIYSIESDGYGKYTPAGTDDNPTVRLCSRCCTKDYIISEKFTKSRKKRYLRRDPSNSDLRNHRIDKILNKKS